MAHVGKYRVRRGLFGRAVLQSLIKYPSSVGHLPDSSCPVYEWVDALKAYQELAPFLRSKGIHCSLPEEFKL